MIPVLDTDEFYACWMIPPVNPEMASLYPAPSCTFVDGIVQVPYTFILPHGLDCIWEIKYLHVLSYEESLRPLAEIFENHRLFQMEWIANCMCLLGSFFFLSQECFLSLIKIACDPFGDLFRKVSFID